MLSDVAYDSWDYSNPNDLDSKAIPSQNILKLIQLINRISTDLDPSINRESVLQALLEGLAEKMRKLFKGLTL